MSEERPRRSIASSRTETTSLMTPDMANFAGNVHGGHVLRLIDQIAYACASSYSGNYCVTRSVDRVDFRVPVQVGELLVLQAQVNFVGRTSMEVGVRAETRHLRSGVTRHTNSCYLTMVALDEQTRRPTTVPELVCESDEDRRRFAEGSRRRKRAKLIRLVEESEQRYNGIIEQAQVPLLLIDAEQGRVQDANARARELFALDSEAALAERTLWDLLGPAEVTRKLFDQARTLGFGEDTLHAGETPVEVSSWLLPLPGRDLVQCVVRPAR